MTFSNLWKTSLIILSLVSCSSPASEETKKIDYMQSIDSYFSKRGVENVLNDKSAFIYYSEAMNCVKCTDAMIKATAPVLDNEKGVYLVSGRGNAVDISSLIEKERPNVHRDLNYEFIDEVGLDRSCFLLLNEQNNIDTIVYLDALQIQTQIRLLLKHLRENV